MNRVESETARYQVLAHQLAVSQVEVDPRHERAGVRRRSRDRVVCGRQGRSMRVTSLPPPKKLWRFPKFLSCFCVETEYLRAIAMFVFLRQPWTRSTDKHSHFGPRRSRPSRRSFTRSSATARRGMKSSKKSRSRFLRTLNDTTHRDRSCRGRSGLRARRWQTGIGVAVVGQDVSLMQLRWRSRMPSSPSRTKSARSSSFLTDCLGRLEGRSREICDLRYRTGLSPTRIASALNMQANTVSKALQRIRGELRACIELRMAAERAD